MASYSDILQRLGSQAGASTGAAGGGLLGHLSSLLSPLDLPREALYNSFQGLASGNTDDMIKALPGLIGGLAGVGAGMTGFGLPAAIGIGSLVGGASQGAAKVVDPEKFKAPEVGDLAESLGLDRENVATNFGLGMLTDPLSYAGGFGGAAKGAAKGAEAGAALGGRWERIAAGMAPYNPDKAKLAKLMESPGLTYNVRNSLQKIMDEQPALAKQIAGELPNETATMSNPVLGSGLSAIGVKRPEGGVTRIGFGEILSGRTGAREFEPPRINAPEMVQPARSVSFGNQVRVEHVPYVKPFNADVYDVGQADMTQQALKQGLANRGLKAGDLHYENFGLDQQGNPKILDPGRITETRPGALAEYAGQETPRQAGTAPERWFLKLFDPHGVSKELEQQLARPNPWQEAGGLGQGATPAASKPQLAGAIEGMAKEPGPGTLERLQRGGEGGGKSPLSPLSPQSELDARLAALQRKRNWHLENVDRIERGLRPFQDINVRDEIPEGENASMLHEFLSAIMQGANPLQWIRKPKY